MVSKRMFNSLNELFQLKNKEYLFGGIQMVFCGDFKQLPPVPNSLYDEDGEFCFTSEIFEDVFPHRIVLSTVIRQSEFPLIKAIRETAGGNLSPETVSLIQELQRPLPETSGSNIIKLYANNELVDDYNRQCILNMEGDLYELKSNDTGEVKYLNRLLAPKILWLKKGAPVLLLRNLSDKLVNGLRGTVLDICDGQPLIQFDSFNNPIPLEKMKFSVFSPTKNKDIAERNQYPVKLAFSMTIHKAQGLTLDRVEVDCRHIFKAGQLSVAMGRVKRSEGLRVLNFSTQYCIPQPQSVSLFMDQPSKEAKEDHSCCFNKALRSCPTDTSNQFTYEELAEIKRLQHADGVEYIDVFDDEFDADIINLLQQQTNDCDLPDDLNINSILASIRHTDPVTPVQHNINRILDITDHNKIATFCKKEFSKMSSLIEELQPNYCEGNPVSTGNQSKFYSKVHEYLTGLEFRMNCLEMFEEQFTGDHLHVCYNISVSIRKYLLSKKCLAFPVSDRGIVKRQVTDTSHARIRYISGYCIAKLRQKYCKQKLSNMYDTSKDGIKNYEKAKSALHVLDSLKVSKEYVRSTATDPQSLVDIDRRQNHHHSLTNISDDLFGVFLELTKKCTDLLVDKVLNLKGTDMFEYIKNTIKNDKKIKDQFVHVSNMNNSDFETNTNDQTEEIYERLVKQFLMVIISQFRKDVIESFRISKKMAHRKQVRIRNDVSAGNRKKIKEKEKSDRTEQPSTSDGRSKRKYTTAPVYCTEIEESESEHEEKSKKQGSPLTRDSGF